MTVSTVTCCMTRKAICRPTRRIWRRWARIWESSAAEFGRRKINAEESVTEKRTPEKGQIKQYLDALSFLSSFVMDKKEALVEEELKTIREIDKVKDSYTEVIEHNAAVSDAVDAFQSEFERIGGISGQFNEVISGVTEVSNGALQVIRELKESYEKVERQFAEINKVYDEFQTSSESLTSSLSGVRKALDVSQTQMENTKQIFQEINRSVYGVEDVHRGINEVVGHCTSKVEQLQSNMGAHERRYEQVQMNIDGLKSLMTQKGFIYEDISNMMEQAQPLIQNIQKEL